MRSAGIASSLEQAAAFAVGLPIAYGIKQGWVKVQHFPFDRDRHAGQWTATPWPGLAVAVITAGLFLHSSGSIIRDAVNGLNSSW